ncbi:MAG: hypothetical protein ACOCXH_04830 [Cyclobacteriaceae bacterium]
MKNNLDQFFKIKTEGFQKQPSAEAWNKINKNLHPRSRVPVWQIAASVILIAAVAAVIYLQFNIESNNTPAIVETELPDTAKQNNLVAPRQDALANKNTKQQEEATEEAKDNTVTPDPAQKPDILVAQQTETGKLIPAKNELKRPDIIETPQIIDNNNALANAAEIPVNPITEAEVREEEKAERQRKRPTVTIVYQKSTNESTTVAKNEEKELKESLGKILNLAKDLKNSELALAEIRDVKDDLFALDINIRRNNTKTRD